MQILWWISTKIFVAYPLSFSFYYHSYVIRIALGTYSIRYCESTRYCDPAVFFLIKIIRKFEAETKNDLEVKTNGRICKTKSNHEADGDGQCLLCDDRSSQYHIELCPKRIKSLSNYLTLSSS